MFDDIVLFVHIVQNRGLAAAAQQLGMPAATITRRLQRLEADNGCQLLHRSARQFVLTLEGEAFYSAYAPLVAQFESTQRGLSLQLHEMCGKLKVLAPTHISHGILQPMWSGFIKAYPQIQLELLLNNQLEDLLSAKADLALRIGPQQDSLLYQKRLGALHTILVASPEYLQNHHLSANIEGLKDHQLLGSTILSHWELTNTDSGKRTQLHPNFNTITNDLRLIAEFATDGLGIALLPLSEVYKQLQSGQLQHVLARWQGPVRQIFVLWPSGRLLNAKAQCLREYMQQYIEENLADF